MDGGKSRDAPNRPTIGIGRLSAVLPIIRIGKLVHWYRQIVVYTVGKYSNKHDSGFRLSVLCSPSQGFP